MQIEHKKNTAFYLAFPMVNSSTPASFATGESVSDTAYYKDGAGAWTTLAITDTVSEIGTTGMYEIDLTAAEMNHDQVLIKVSSAGAADSAFLFQLSTNSIDDVSAYDPSTDTVEGALTYDEAIRIMLAESAGKVSVSGATVTFRDRADTKDRITATTDSTGQRTSVTVDGS